MKRKGMIFLLVLIVLAVIDSAYLANLHYSTGESFCDRIKIGEARIDCGTVNRGAYSEFPPWTFTWWVDAGLPSIPNSILAVVTFIALGVLAISSLRTQNPQTERKLYNWIFGILLISFFFGLWLIYIQKFVLATWCLLCLVLDVLILLSLITIVAVRRKKPQ